MTKSQLAVIDDLQNNSDYVILNNLFAIPNFVKLVGQQRKERSEVYTPKIFFEIVSQLTPKHLERDGDYVAIEFSVGDFLTAIASTNSNNDYNHVINCVKKMQQISVEFENEDTIAGFSVIPYYKYEKGDKTICLHIRKELAQSILTVKKSENFSFLKKYLFRLNNAQAIKLFPYFMSWRHRGMVEMTLEAFKKRFNCETAGYSKFSNLKLKILDPAITEINDKTDLIISYKLLGENLTGTRPRIAGLQFFIVDKGQQKQLGSVMETAEFEEVKPPKTTVSKPEKSTEIKVENMYLADILRVFQVFEPNSTPESIAVFLTYFDDPKAVLEACLYAEEEQSKGHLIKNFRGYLVTGVPKGLGAGILEQREKAQKQAQQVAQKKKNELEKAAELTNLLKEAEILRGGYKTDINAIMRKTATDDDKDTVADILRAKSSIYAGKTLDDFRSNMYISTYIKTFIETYPERFEEVQQKYQKAFDALTAKIKKLDAAKGGDLFYY